MYLHANYNLIDNNTFHLPATAKFFIEIRHASAIATMRRDPVLSSLPWTVIGAGSNILLTQNLDHVVLHCTYDEIKLVKEDKDFVWLSVGAGYKWHDLVTYTVNQGWWGLENLALIPGTVGAAPVQNIGAYGAEARDTVTRIQTFDLMTGERIELRNSECQFNYRDSIFKHELANKTMVHRVTFRLRKQASPNLMYEPLREAFEDQDSDHLTPKAIYQKVIDIRNSRIPDPKKLGHAGSFFQNPTVTPVHFQHLQEVYPEIPGHKQIDGCIKVPAAWLIDKAGWKGKRIGDAGIYDKHALILVNYGHATGKELLDFAQLVRQDIIEKFGISLDMEVVTL